MTATRCAQVDKCRVCGGINHNSDIAKQKKTDNEKGIRVPRFWEGLRQILRKP